MSVYETGIVTSISRVTLDDGRICLRSTVEFYDGACPNLTFGTVWKKVPVQIVPEEEIKRLKAQIEDAETAIKCYDEHRDSEYWSRYPNEPGDFVALALNLIDAEHNNVGPEKVG